MHRQETLLTNKIHKILLDFEKENSQLISARRPDLVLIRKKKKKKTGHLADFAVPADHTVKIKQNEKIEKSFFPTR